jgi:hypothetical protein
LAGPAALAGWLG